MNCSWRQSHIHLLRNISCLVMACQVSPVSIDKPSLFKTLIGLEAIHYIEFTKCFDSKANKSLNT